MGLKVQVDGGLVREVDVLKLISGSDITFTEVDASGDTADVAVSASAGGAGGIDASEVTVDSAALDGVAVTVQGALEELEDAIDALEGDGSLKSWSASFVETAGAGTYTAQKVLAAGSIIHSVSWETTVEWGADTTTADFGYTGSLAAYGNDVDVDAVAGDQVFGLDTEDVDDFPAGTTFNAVFTTTGAGTTAGRSRVTIEYSVPPTATVATKT